MGGNRGTEAPVRVLLADDHTMFRQGLAGILASYGGMEVVGEVPNDDDALNAPFLKGGTQKCASDASVVWAIVPTPMLWPCGLAAGWRPSLPDLSRSCRRSPARPKPAA